MTEYRIRNPHTMFGFARLLDKGFNEYKEAAIWYRRAIDAMPKFVFWMHTYANLLLHQLKKWVPELA